MKENIIVAMDTGSGKTHMYVCLRGPLPDCHCFLPLVQYRPLF